MTRNLWQISAISLISPSRFSELSWIHDLRLLSGWCSFHITVLIQKKWATEGGMVRWYHWLNGHEFEQALRDSEGQVSLACCSLWGHKELDTTERLNWSEQFRSWLKQWVEPESLNIYGLYMLEGEPLSAKLCLTWNLFFIHKVLLLLHVPLSYLSISLIQI